MFLTKAVSQNPFITAEKYNKEEKITEMSSLDYSGESGGRVYDFPEEQLRDILTTNQLIEALSRNIG